MNEKVWIVELIMENKPAARDPVGETIRKDLLSKKNFNMVTNLHSGQYLRVTINAENKDHAKLLVEKMCNHLRIFNPITQNLNIIKITQLD